MGVKSNAAGSARGLKVLVVDDSTDAARMFALMLKLEGHDARPAHDGLAALAAVKDFTPDAAFLDIRLPGMDGYELARRLREVPSLTGLVLVAMTGFGEEEDRRRSLEAGFDHHLVKPADPALVGKILAQHPRLGPQPGQGQ